MTILATMISGGSVRSTINGNDQSASIPKKQESMPAGDFAAACIRGISHHKPLAVATSHATLTKMTRTRPAVVLIRELDAGCGFEVVNGCTRQDGSMQDKSMQDK
ncbi:MAG: hypothetical protein R3C17_18000 [Planctomycetaceae bacterium]